MNKNKVCAEKIIFVDFFADAFSHHHHCPPLLGSGNLNRVDGGEEDPVADADEEATDIDEGEAGGTRDADPCHQYRRAG